MRKIYLKTLDIFSLFKSKNDFSKNIAIEHIKNGLIIIFPTSWFLKNAQVNIQNTIMDTIICLIL